MLSREELARKSGISVSAVAKIEKGQVVPRIASKRKILEALGLPLERADEVFPR